MAAREAKSPFKTRTLVRALVAMWSWYLLFAGSAIVLLVVLDVPQDDDLLIIPLAIALIGFPAYVIGLSFFVMDAQRSAKSRSDRLMWQALILYTGPFAATAYLFGRPRTPSASPPAAAARLLDGDAAPSPVTASTSVGSHRT